MTRRIKNPALTVFLLHVLQFVFVAGVMYVVYSRTTLDNEALATLDQAALVQKNAGNSLVVGLASAIPSFLMWYFYLLPKIMGRDA